MALDPVLLSRVQWGWVIAWHILLPAFTVGLASYIAVLEGLYFFTGREIWFRISGFWTRIFAVSFGMGVVSGIIMPFQFGTNWSRFTDATADVISPLLAYEGLMAFFLEASFLGVLLFGRRLVPAWAHFFAALMVAFGTLLSSFWILATNSWMQTPAGYKLVDGRFAPVDWFAIIFNPSFPYRLLHNVTAFYITTAFVVMGVGAWLLRRDRADRGSADDDPHGARSADHPRSAADRFSAISTASTRCEYQPAKARGDRGPLRYRAADAADAVRHSRRRRGDHALRDRNPESRQPHSHPFLERRDQGAQGMAGGSAAAGRRRRSSPSASWSGSA